MKYIKLFEDFSTNEGKMQKIEKNYGKVEVSDKGIVKSIVGYDGKKIGEVYIDGEIYRFNTKYKTYNSTTKNELLTDKDLDSVEIDY
jgi:hypothetical protein